MAERFRRYPRHPIAKRYPADPPARIELEVRRGYYDDLPRDYVSEQDSIVCDCFPRTSKMTIPSMFYDKITCPHKDHAHIQPAQETQFNYPWTARSINRRHQRDDDELSERMSLISEEDDQLRFSPHRLDQPADTFSIATAPPYWYKQEINPRTQNAPFTAPNNDLHTLPGGRRAQSMQDIRNPAYRSDGIDSTRDLNRSRKDSRLSNRSFTGNYVDARDGKVYQYNVNYDGTPNPTGTRSQLPTKKPTTAV